MNAQHDSAFMPLLQEGGLTLKVERVALAWLEQSARMVRVRLARLASAVLAGSSGGMDVGDVGGVLDG